MEYVVQTFGLSKKYARQTVVDQVNMNIRKGDIYGFVGENGSGKTTIIRMITGLIRPTAGTIRLFGVDHKDPKVYVARRKMGAVVETPAICLNMTAKENLMHQAQILGLQDDDKVQTILAKVGLQDVVNSKKLAGNFSLGMRQRLGIAMALMGDPEFLILDEPMNGLDPAGIVEIRELILALHRQGITLLISSHILTELSLVATNYGIISKGKLLQEVTATELRNCTGKQLLLRAQDSEALAAFVRTQLPDTPVSLVDDVVKISGDVDLNSLLKAAIDGGNRLESVVSKETGFEEYYMNLLGGSKYA